LIKGDDMDEINDVYDDEPLEESDMEDEDYEDLDDDDEGLI
jgi:hypothetical protein